MSNYQMERVGGRTFASSSLNPDSMVVITIAQDAQARFGATEQTWEFEYVDEWHVRARMRARGGSFFEEVYCRDMRHSRGFARQLTVIKAARVYVLPPHEVTAFYLSKYWLGDEGVLR